MDREAHYVCAGGIRSTGLTAGMAIAEWVRDGLADAGLDLRERIEALPEITMPNIGEAFPRPYMRGRRWWHSTPSTVRSCCLLRERVTRGEIRDALGGRDPALEDDSDGLRRRTRALAGRCQGFFCGAHVSAVARAGTATGQ